MQRELGDKNVMSRTNHPFMRLGAAVSLIAATLAMIAGLALVASPAGATSGDALEITSGPAASTQAGVAQTVVVKVYTDGSFTTVDTTDNDLITLSTSPATTGAQISGNSVSAVNGVATFSNLVINTTNAGYTLQATDAASGVTASPASSSFAITPGSAYKLAFTSQPPAGTAASTAFSPNVAVSVEDAFGNVVTSSSASVVLSTSTSGCTLGGTLTEPASSGVATFPSLTLTSGENCVITATSGSLVTAASSTVSVLGTVSKLIFTTEPPATDTYGVAMSAFNVSVEDQYGNVVTSGTGSGDVIDLTAEGGCATTPPTPSATASNGVAHFTGVYFVSGATCTLQASDTSRTGITVGTSTTIAASSSAAGKLGFSVAPATTATAGSILPSFTVATEQGNGTPVTSGNNTTDVVTLSSTCKLVGVTSGTESAGAVIFNDVSIDTAGSCTIIATDASSTAIAAATSVPVVVTATAPTHLVFTVLPATTSTLSAPMRSFAVSVEDAYGNVTTTTTGSTYVVTLTSACTLAGTTAVTAVAGVATFTNAEITAPGTCVLTATAPGVTAVTANVSVGTSQTALSVKSTSGHLDTPLVLTTSGGSGTGAVTFTVVNGTATGCSIASGRLSANTKGTCIVTATKAGSGTYVAATSTATAVTIGTALPRMTRVAGTITFGKTTHVTIIGVGFYGRPRIISNVARFTALVSRDTGKALVVTVTVRSVGRAGTHVLTLIEPNGTRTSLRYTLR